MPVISTTDLAKHYRKAKAVDGISFEVERGQIFGFLGPNGAGKTTTIGLLLGIITPTSGSFSLLGGSSAAELHAARRRTGATLEYPNFYPHLSGYDNLRLAARVKGAGIKEIDEALEVVGLTERRKSLFKAYSLGMKQRLALASAMLGDPELIMLDEPANGLDPKGMREIRDIIVELGERGKTIFLSSHLLWEVERTCTHVAIIKRGKIISQSSVADLTSENAVARLKAPDLDRLESIVSDYPKAITVVREDGSLAAELEDEDLETLNRFVAERGVYMSHLALEQRSLEDVFMEITQTREMEVEQ